MGSKYIIKPLLYNKYTQRESYQVLGAISVCYIKFDVEIVDRTAGNFSF